MATSIIKDSRLPLESVASVSTTSAVSASNLRYSKCGRLITLSGWLKCDTNPSENVTLFTLPKPVHEIQVVAYDQNSPNTVPAFTFRSTNGHMDFYRGSIAGHYVNFALTYITVE